LSVTDKCQSVIFRVNEPPIDFTIQKYQLLLQNGMAVLRQCVNQVLDHRAQSSRNLHVLCSAMANFCQRQMDKSSQFGVLQITATRQSRLTPPGKKGKFLLAQEYPGLSVVRDAKVEKNVPFCRNCIALPRPFGKLGTHRRTSSSAPSRRWECARLQFPCASPTVSATEGVGHENK
jgi:hypothetical protein